jgi:glucosamine--fructose-6-phosphate aminotransferase (isomerizing)
VALAAIWAGDDNLWAELSRVPVACQTLISAYQALAHNLGSDSAIERFYFLGSGPRYGLACELSLKMKEMSLSHSEPFHFMEFRHGPRSMVTPETLIVGLVSEVNRAHELTVLEDMRAQGGRILALAERDADVSLASGIGEAARNALYLPIGQLLAFEHAVHKGLNPDQPDNLLAVVRLDQ